MLFDPITGDDLNGAGRQVEFTEKIIVQTLSCMVNAITVKYAGELYQGVLWMDWTSSLIFLPNVASRWAVAVRGQWKDVGCMLYWNFRSNTRVNAPSKQVNVILFKNCEQVNYNDLSWPFYCDIVDQWAFISWECRLYIYNKQEDECLEWLFACFNLCCQLSLDVHKDHVCYVLIHLF